MIAIVSQPAKAWAALKEKDNTEDHDVFLSRYLYPIIGLVTIAAFIGILFTLKEFHVELALNSAIRTLISSF